MGVKKKKCAVPGCNFYAVTGDGKTVFHFPQETSRRRSWMKLLGNVELLSLKDKTVLTTRFVCPAHFEDDMFWDRLHNRLQRTAVPSKFLPPELPDGEMVEWDRCHGRKRSFSEVEPGDEGYVTGEAEKCPRRDTATNGTPRRSRESVGARVRSSSPPSRMSLKKLCESAGVRAMSPQKQQLAKTAQEYRQMALQFRRKLEIARRRYSSLSKLASTRFVDMMDELTISPLTKQFVKSEMVNMKRHKNRRVGTVNDKLSALSIYKRSTRAYTCLRQYMILPSENSLKNLLQLVPLEPGISDTLLELLKKKMSKMTPEDRNCVVAFDEVFLRGRLSYNRQQNKVTGFENYGHKGSTNRLADHALVFMAQGLYEKWTFPVAYCFVSKTCPSTMLKLLIRDVVKSLFAIGLNVFGTVSDQGATNQGAISELKQESGDSVSYCVNDHKLVHVWDMPPLFKKSGVSAQESTALQTPSRVTIATPVRDTCERSHCKTPVSTPRSSYQPSTPARVKIFFQIGSHHPHRHPQQARHNRYVSLSLQFYYSCFGRSSLRAGHNWTAGFLESASAKGFPEA
ncbi:DNA transposase [Frankliniella fusca]|uniref:DNA transposase n=1 Tax=Frankliniella fusca TaxID=407009 RepID=A0AAE1HRC1_9NEOP|nr:DNA transposase [Frankliniella fusca]